MRRNHKLLIVLILVLSVIALLVFPVGKRVTLPFAAEEVSSVILWSFWGNKEASDAEDIAMIVEEMNEIRLCGEFDLESDEPRAGDYSCTAYFVLKDGSIYEYRSMPKPGLTAIFRNADGICYKAKNVPLKALYQSLELELRAGNPFQSQ